MVSCGFTKFKKNTFFTEHLCTLLPTSATLVRKETLEFVLTNDSKSLPFRRKERVILQRILLLEKKK